MTDRRREREDQGSRVPKPGAPHSAEKPAAGKSGSSPASASQASPASASTSSSGQSDPENDRRVRRARFLADLAEARELRKRVAPRKARAAELQARVLRTFRY
jgi:hypothetical protein